MAQRFPLLGTSLAIYWALGFLTIGRFEPWYQSNARSIALTSGDVWQITNGDVFLAFSMTLLFVELLRSTRSSNASITNHALSVLVFVGAFVLFLSQPGYGNSVFFMFMSMTAIDFVAGFIITTTAARRDVSVGRAADQS